MISDSFFALTPERVLDAVEAAGFQVTGRCFALNSYENRVYEVELEDEPEGTDLSGIPGAVPRKRVVKFYRPGRWTDAQILEEHGFLLELQNLEFPVVPVLPFRTGGTLHHVQGTELRCAVFPKVGGRSPEEFNDEELLQMGRLLGRLHNAGASRSFQHRLQLSVEKWGREPLAFLSAQWIGEEYRSRYQEVAERIFQFAEPFLARAKTQRIHGDCHLGNLLWNRGQAFFLDFDDSVVGPAVQDLWLMAPGGDPEANMRRELVLEGYEQMRPFDRAELAGIPYLRGLRIIHYSAWLAKRWEDPAFPRAFPHFGSPKYWEEEIRILRELGAPPEPMY